MSHSERYEKLLDRNYKKQLEIEQLKRIQNQANIQRVQNKSAEFVEQKRFLRLLKNEQLELDMEEAIQKVSFTVHFLIVFFSASFLLRIVRGNS